MYIVHSVYILYVNYSSIKIFLPKIFILFTQNYIFEYLYSIYSYIHILIILNICFFDQYVFMERNIK